MATVTAEDIRKVADRIRAAAAVVAPYERREPYEFEIFEPLMKMLPRERVPYDPRPRRPDETAREYHLVWRHHFNLWLLQEINDYFMVKGGRLLSPSSDIDDDDDVRAHEALYDQERLLRGMDIVEREFLLRPAVYEEPEMPPELLERLRERLREAREERLSKESSEDIDISRSGNGGPAAEQQDMDGSVLHPSIERSPERPQSRNGVEASSPPRHNLEPSPKRKRGSLPVDDNALGVPSKKQRTDKHPQLSTALNTAGYKRKRDRDEPLDKLSSAGEPGQPSDKKRRLNTERRIQPSRQRKRGSREYEEELPVCQPGHEVPETKRRRVSKPEVTDAEQSAQGTSTAVGSGHILATAPSPRITRARRRQLSGEDAQLLQLDQRGKPDVQEPKHVAQEPARELLATSQNGRRLKKVANVDVKNSRTKTTTKTITKTRSRSASSKTGGKGRLSST
ncbi:hypothetical protein J3F83DRAFT_510143 [Trichoderma novae-zelandiae]